MKKICKKVMFGTAILAACLTFAFAFATCKQDSDGTLLPDITYTATANGNALTRTDKIVFEFSAYVASLSKDDITIGGSPGSAWKGDLAGGGMTWTLDITVTKGGAATVSVNKAYIDTGPKGIVLSDGSVPMPTPTGAPIALDVRYSDGTLLSGTIVPGGASPVVVNGAIPSGTIMAGVTTPAGKSEILIGRKSEETVFLNISSGGILSLRPADGNGIVPIGSYAEFQLIRDALSGAYKQEAELDLMNVDWEPLGAMDLGSLYFSGTFDGDGKKINNLRVNKTTSDKYVGLFGFMSGTVKNVRIASGSVSGTINAGGVVGYNFGGSIIACYNGASIQGGSNSGSSAGGIAGWNLGISGTRGSIIACYNTGTVSGGNVGGITGANNNTGSITACYKTGTVTGGTNSGGIAAESVASSGGPITACYNLGSVSGGTSGGVAGRNMNTITDCYWESTTASAAVGDNTYGTVTGGGSFTAGAMPSPSTLGYAEWTLASGSPGSVNQYWKNLTGPNAAGASLPALWFE